ncbi:hypothetical protein CCH79_00014303 [Gambusia affinis]|uniref:Uncharacterized protein n=1 Tax=Gambusia affinis TaxID=33528 RepID=A0A315UTW0_GAMAF|nr:hypothetical protein CCH79_00014303 [Gambusia affinis]
MVQVLLTLLPPFDYSCELREEQEWMGCHLPALAFTLTHTISPVKTSPRSALRCVQTGLDSLMLKQLLPGGVDSRNSPRRPQHASYALLSSKPSTPQKPNSPRNSDIHNKRPWKRPSSACHPR